MHFMQSIVGRGVIFTPPSLLSRCGHPHELGSQGKQPDRTLQLSPGVEFEPDDRRFGGVRGDHPGATGGGTAGPAREGLM